MKLIKDVKNLAEEDKALMAAVVAKGLLTDMPVRWSTISYYTIMEMHDLLLEHREQFETEMPDRYYRVIGLLALSREVPASVYVKYEVEVDGGNYHETEELEDAEYSYNRRCERSPKSHVRLLGLVVMKERPAPKNSNL